MELVSKCLKRKLPSELYGKVEAYAHDLRPVMKELLQKRRPKIPFMLISFEKIEHVTHLRKRYKDEMHTIGKDNRAFQFYCEIGESSSICKTKYYRYVRRPRWMARRSRWREIGVLI